MATGRGLWARRHRDLTQLYADDLGRDLSEVQWGLIATAATLRCALERMEGQLSLGAEVDLDLFGRLTGHYRRIAETLGIERRAKDVTPDLQSYLASKAQGS